MAQDTQPAAQPQNKLQEQATSKADLSYSYWASNQTGPSQPPPPKKLTEEELKSQQDTERSKSAAGASAWNHAGTFEERCVTGWAKDRLKALLVGQRSGVVEVAELTTVKGDANIWHVRGKKRCGFDFELSLSWTATVEGSEKQLKGTFSVPNAVVDDLDDLEVNVTVEGGTSSEHAQAARKHALGLKDVVQQQLEQLLSEMKDK